MKSIYRYLVLSILQLALAACVGTVADKNSQVGNVTDTGSAATPVSFSGLFSANPIAHNKVELTFFPAKGDQNNITYEIYINGSPIASKLAGKTLIVNSKGLMTTVITNLTMNTTYSFNMKAQVVGTSSTSVLDPTKSLPATTFANETADFLGISNVVLGAGESGTNTVIVNWLAAVTKGSNIAPKANDPVAYEVRYISQLGGIANLNNNNYTGPDRSIIQSPATLTTAPSLSTQTSMTINGLNPGTVYYFQVRAVHKNYAIYGADPNYKKESNTKYLFIKTLNSSGIFDFNPSQVSLSQPPGEPGLTRLNVSWLPASGSFYNYRVCYVKVAQPNILPANVTTVDNLQDNNSLQINDCIEKSADETFHQLISLDSYAYYQVKVVACKTSTCELNNRIVSNLMSSRVIARVAQFGGILGYENPSTEAALSTITVNFDPPITATGYINQMRIYCYNNSSDTNPVRIDNLAFPTAATGKSICNGITIDTVMPTTLNDFNSLDKIEITLPIAGIDGIKNYCFSLVPTIDNPNLLQSDVTNAVVKCFTPQIKTPNVVQFPGRDEACTVINKDIQITWPIPTGGLYSKFAVFYQEKPSGSEFFNFQDAITEFTNNTPTNYRWVSNIDKALIAQNITGLIPGSKYNIGVLPYLNLPSGDKLWGQMNYSVGECSLPLPKAKFKEWFHVLAIGPKEDGLTPPDQVGERKYILETINGDELPEEIQTTALDVRVPDIANPLAATKLGTINFDGIYGRYKSIEANPLHQYSNSGIVKLTWEDVTLYNNTESLNTYNDTLALKKVRKYGYKVYRSEDNKLTWKDLTLKSLSNTNQTTENSGLIQTYSLSWKKRSNAATTVSKVASFTDYSVKFSGLNGDNDRARIYYYKIVPVFNGKEILYDDATNLNHNVIKVILPPRNMSLVNRLIANRTICYEMDLPIKKTSGDFYSCDYDGIGATSIKAPTVVGRTVYDAGGDILMDRFELGVPFTRGDQDVADNDSSHTGTKLNFTGVASSGRKFTGCFNNTSVKYEPNQGAGLASGSYSYDKLIPGDCIGSDAPMLASYGSTTCSDPTKVGSTSYLYPGATGQDLRPDCTDQAYAGGFFANLTNSTSIVNSNPNFAQAQGEFAALYFLRSGNSNLSGDQTLSLYNYPAGNSKFINHQLRTRLTNTFLNLPYIDNSNFMQPRWISINQLFGELSVGNASGAYSSVTSVNLYDKTVDQIAASTLYDSTNVKAPTALLPSYRYIKETTPLARIFSSNAAKLPPLQGLSSSQYHKVCSTYKIQVGIETSANGFRSTIGNTLLSKRIMRKKESTVASAWPATWDSSKVLDIEKGVDASTKGCNGVSKVTPQGTPTLSKNSTLDNFIPWAYSTNPYSLTGSSGNNSSSLCTSRFGIQDLVGNLREINSDHIYCAFLSTNPGVNKPAIYIGDENIKDINRSVPYDSQYHYDFTTAKAWIRGYNDSGSCSVVETGSSQAGNYSASNVFNSIYLPDSNSINSAVVSKSKTYDQASVLTARNGDGTFLDFGLNNVGPVLNGPNAFNKAGMFFNAVLGIPLECSGGCNIGQAEDNKRLATEYHNALPGSIYTPAETPITDFPIGNSSFNNYGVEDFDKYGTIGTDDSNLTFPFDFVSGVNDLGTAALNTLSFTTLNSPSPSPGALYRYAFKVYRNSEMRFTTGGSAANEPGRYTFMMDGPGEYDDRYLTDKGTRCSILIEE